MAQVSRPLCPCRLCSATLRPEDRKGTMDQTEVVSSEVQEQEA